MTSNVPDIKTLDCNSTAVSKYPKSGIEPMAKGASTAMGKAISVRRFAGVSPAMLVATPLLG